MVSNPEGGENIDLKNGVPTLKVFQASPLAYEDWSGREVPIACLDLESECSALKEAMDGTGIDLAFEIATSNNLGRFLSEGNRLLHFSCHGHPKYLFIENDYGGAQMLLVDEHLKSWISAGKDKLSFVFVSACQSRSAGEAFVAAGVEHVVCCEHNEQVLSNMAAIIFARDFYRSLANNRTIQEAFDLAIMAVIQSPEMKRTGLNPKAEASKFALLPAGADHNVSISFDHHRKHLQKSESNMGVLDMLPVPPQDFLGRDVYMYRVLKSLMVKKARLVRITGPEGIGKSSLAKAVGHYMLRRNMYGNVYWFPSTRKGKGNDITSLWSKLGDLIENEKLSRSKFQSDNQYKTVLEDLIDILYEKQAVLIVNTARMSDKAIQKMCSFLDELFENTKNVRVIVLHRSNKKIQSSRPTGFPVTETLIPLGPLDFGSTILLFGKHCEHVAPNNWSPELLLKKRSEVTFRVLGQGIPTRTVIAAKNMPRNEYDKLVDEAIPVDEQNFSVSIRKIEEFESCAIDTPRLSTLDIQPTCPDGENDDDGGDGNNGGISDEERPPLRSQLEVQKRFGQLLRKEGVVCRKNVTSFIRRAKKGEKIVTTIDGIHESANTVKDDTSWVVCGQAAGEHYVLSQQNFDECYDATTAKPIVEKAHPRGRRLKQQGFQEYQSKRRVWARKVDENDMKYFCYGKEGAQEAYFMAPWGESMRVEQGDFLVTQYPGGNDEVYRVECAVFEYSYKEDSEGSGSSEKWFWIATTAAVTAGVALLATVLIKSAKPRR